MSWTVAGKVCVVTGGNSGIGLATVKGLAQRGARVALVARDAERGAAALAEAQAAAPEAQIDLVQGDLGTVASTRALAEALLAAYPELHVLVNNAGTWLGARATTEDGLEATFAINHLGPFLLTQLLLERLKASGPARIVNVSSHLHRKGRVNLEEIADPPTYHGMQAYSDSKLCNVLFTRELARRLDGTDVTTYSLHPGVVRTGIARRGNALANFAMATLGYLFLLSPAKGARTSLHCAVEADPGAPSGSYFRNRKPERPSKAAEDDALARGLWALSERLCGLEEPSAAE